VYGVVLAGRECTRRVAGQSWACPTRKAPCAHLAEPPSFSCHVICGTVQLVLVDCCTVSIGRLQITRRGRSASVPGGRRALPTGPGGWVHKHYHKPVVQDILVAFFNCYLLSLLFLVLFSCWCSGGLSRRWSVGQGGYALLTNLRSPARTPSSHTLSAIHGPSLVHEQMTSPIAMGSVPLLAKCRAPRVKAWPEVLTNP